MSMIAIDVGRANVRIWTIRQVYGVEALELVR